MSAERILPQKRKAGERGIQTERKQLSGLLHFFGPAFVVSVAYIDPGNFATNIVGGSKYGYTLLWVILWSNIMAVFLQSLSAKLGIATGNNLAQMCRLVFPVGINRLLYLVATFAAMATTMAEFIGGVLGLQLLTGMSALWASVLTILVSLLITGLQSYGQRLVELVIALFIGAICIAYLLALILAGPDWQQAAIHTILPSLPNADAVLIASGMLGATVMPHVIFLHSQLVQNRNQGLSLAQKRKHLKHEKIDILLAMNLAFLVNAAMVVVSAAAFFSRSIPISSIEEAHRSLTPLLGSISSGIFGIALLASGFSSTSVGAMAGETVMDGFISFRMPIAVRRVITLLPGLVVVLAGVDTMQALVLSQVSLSFALPFAILPMLIITGMKRCMGEFTNKKWERIVGWTFAAVITILNLGLLLLNL